MQFILAESDRGAKELSKVLAESLAAGQHVLWLVSGGSNVPITVRAMSMIPVAQTNNLTIMPVDERYGPFGHDDSNATKLFKQGLDLKRASFINVLSNLSLDKTVQRYNQITTEHFAKNQIIVAQFGMGADGHIAGILPHSAATNTQPGPEFAIGYRWSDFDRLTLTFRALERVSIAFVFAYGQDKQSALSELHDKGLPLEVQPAQFLKHIPKAYVYNDQIE